MIVPLLLGYHGKGRFEPRRRKPFRVYAEADHGHGARRAQGGTRSARAALKEARAARAVVKQARADLKAHRGKRELKIYRKALKVRRDKTVLQKWRCVHDGPP